MSHKNHKENILDQLTILRSENPTQYCTLIKMHLSFVTDLSTDQCDGSFDGSGVLNNGKWLLSPLMKKFLKGNSHQQNSAKAILTYDVVNKAFQLMSFLQKPENITQEGLFRKTGSVTRQAELKSSLLVGQNLNLESGNYSAHDCASVLKSFLSDLPEPILQEGEYHVHCRIAELCRKKCTAEQESVAHARQIKALSLVFLLLPVINYELLKELLMLLHQVTLFQDKNKMSSLNLGTMFAPHILCPRKMSPNELQYQSGSLSSTVAFIIENAPHLFQIPSELAIDIREYFKTESMGRQLSKRSMEDAPTKTSMTFIDRELTAEANEKDVTEMALAELYAYVQSLPDSAKKKKLIGKFNEVSGPGTPKYNQSFQKKDLRVKSFGDSIKKHIFNLSIKRLKNKNELPNSINIKRSKSDDYLSTSVFCSPELRTPKSSSVKTKSLENLLSPKFSSIICAVNRLSSNENMANACSSDKNSRTGLSLATTSTPISRNPSINRKENVCSNEEQDIYLNTPVRHNDDDFTCSLIDARSNVNDLASDQDVIEENEEKFANNTPRNNSSFHSYKNNPALGSIYNKEKIISPITRALRNSVDPQKLMLTPRSRRPIIVNSTTSLSSVVIPEDLTEKESISKSLADLHDNTELDEEHIETCSPPLMQVSLVKVHRTESAALTPNIHQEFSSSFEDFYKHLSAPTLEKLADNLRSPKSLRNSTENNASSNHFNCHNISHNETLTSVFKDYLLNRSILADNLVNSSSENQLNENKYDVQDLNLQSEDNDSSENILTINNAANYPELSKSLLFCLDGNNPLHFSSTPKRCSTSPQKNTLSSLPVKKQKFINKSDEIKDVNNVLYDDTVVDTSDTEASDDLTKNQVTNLHTCSPNGRSNSILQNKNGTPVPKREKERIEGTSVGSILFETAF